MKNSLRCAGDLRRASGSLNNAYTALNAVYVLSEGDRDIKGLIESVLETISRLDEKIEEARKHHDVG